MKHCLHKLFVAAVGTTALLVAVASAGIPYPHNDGDLVPSAVAITGDRFVVLTSSPRGVRIYAVTPPSAAAMKAIDDGLAELFLIAKRHGYQRCTSHADYTIFIARADRTRNADGQYSPDIAIGAAQYAGSIYDQGGFVYAAGMVLSMQPCAFIIAEHDHEWQRVINVARYEGEHLVLYHNDRPRFTATMDHSRGGSHPILE